MNPYIELTKQAVESYIKKGKIISPSLDLPSEILNKKAGTFVTVEKNNELRGCIGTYLPTKENIAQEIIHNAIAAAAEDYRFNPIQKQELPELSYTVYILSKPELIKNTKELDPKKYGIIIKTAPISYSGKTDVMFNGHTVPKSGLLLPNLEGINTMEKQLSAVCQKAGINPAAEQVVIYKFTVKKFSQKK